jgi:hypothetical protein
MLSRWLVADAWAEGAGATPGRSRRKHDGADRFVPYSHISTVLGRVETEVLDDFIGNQAACVSSVLMQRAGWLS